MYVACQSIFDARRSVVKSASPMPVALPWLLRLRADPARVDKLDPRRPIVGVLQDRQATDDLVGFLDDAARGTRHQFRQAAGAVAVDGLRPALFAEPDRTDLGQ